MLQKNLILLSVITLCSIPTAAQETKPVQREDSVTVSAGISKEQSALEGRLDEFISQGDLFLEMDRAADAVKRYESASDLVQKQPLPAEQKKRVPEKLATGYIAGNRPSDAIPIYSTLLEASKKDCDSESTALSICAEAQYDLSLAKMRAGDFAGALPFLQQAEAGYAKAQGFGTHEFTVIESKDQAQTELLAAEALERLGRPTEAITAAESAISQLDSVQEDKTVNVGVRDDAKRSPKEARTFLTRLQAAH